MLEERIEKYGFDPKADMKLLETVYGGGSGDVLCPNLYDIYPELSQEPPASVVQAPQGCGSADDRKEKMLTTIRKEIERLDFLRRGLDRYKCLRAEINIESHVVPDHSALDRLIRYEASLERSFDRTLSQLERMQRQRLGYPVPPRISIDVNR